MAQNDLIPERQILGKKPLVEAIFEVKWALEQQAAGVATDPGYQLLLGSFYDKMKDDYPFIQQLPPASAPVEFTGHTVTYQFRAKEAGWPLVQLGPGILTVNDTVGYDWETFRPRLESAIHTLFESYPDKLGEPQPVLSQLRYINAIPLNVGDESAPKFLREKLHTAVQFDARLFEDDPGKSDNPIGFGLNVMFPLETPKGVGGYSIAQGKRGDETALIWELVIRSANDQSPHTPSEYTDWLNQAHDVTGRWFRTLCRGPLHASFK